MPNGKFFAEGDGIFVGKGLSALANSKSSRNDLIRLFGGTANLPSSVMRANKIIVRKDPKFDEQVAVRSYKNTSKFLKTEQARKLSSKTRNSFSASGKGCGAGALSAFPQNIGRAVVLLYSEPGDTIFDPFAGHNSRMDLTIKAGRHYIGCDLSTDFMRSNQTRAQFLRKHYPKSKIELHHCDSRQVPVDDEIGDFTLTSPPYYDIEEYGDEPEQLGKAKTYEGFLEGLGQVMNENYRALKPGAFAVWFVNDFRRKGKTHFYHIDTIRLAEDAGFVAHDIMVVDFGPGIRDCFTNQIITSKILPKRHEYGLVFRKP